MWRYIIALNVVGLLWGIVVVVGLPYSIAIFGTILVVASLAIMFGVETLRARKGAKDLEAALGAQADAFSADVRPDQQVEIEDMRNQFMKELGALKSSKVGGGGMAALYSLPWYMIIGPPGAGKTTALMNSGLNFPSKTGAIKGIGGTRNCDWWLTNEAVILDTAGRYTSEEEDHDEWLSFLDIIKKHRKKKPMNGLIVAVSITDLGGHDDEEIERLAQGVRKRVDEVIERLEMVLPVYLLFTKCDLVPGFVENFSSMRKKERGQIWGSTFRLDQPAGKHAELYSEDLDEISAVQWRRMYVRVEEERRPEYRARIYQFPQQFEAIKPALILIDNLFAPNIYGAPPIMRGVYLTSGTQEGSPIDLLASSIAEAFGVQPMFETADEEAKSYFLRDVFANVMFPDQEVAARSQKGERVVLFQRIAIGVLAAISALLLTILPLKSYLENVDIVDSTDTMVTEIVAEREENKDKVIPPKSLMDLRHRLAKYKEWEAESPPIAMRLGMYQGGNLYPYVRRFYVQTLQKELLEPVIRHDVDEMNTLRQVYGFNSRPSDQEYQRFFDKLKLHLLLTAPHAEGEPPLKIEEEAWVVEQIVRRWTLALEQDPSPEEQEEMQNDIKFYIEMLQNDPLMAMGRNEGAVRDTRNMLNRVSYSEAIIKGIISETSTADRDLNMRRIMGGAVTPIESGTAARVRAAYSAWGWNTIVRKRIVEAAAQSDRWVFGAGTTTSSADFVAELRNQYFKEYINEWSNFIDSLRIKQPADINDSLTMLRDLTRGQPPPLKKLMQVIHDNTNLSEGEQGGAAAAKDSGILNLLVKKVGPLRKVAKLSSQVNLPGGGAGGPRMMGPMDVKMAFKEFTSFGYLPPPPQANPDDPPPPPEMVPADILFEEMISLRDALQTYLEDPRTSGDMMGKLQAARTSAQGLIGALEVGSGWRPKLEALIWPPFEFVQSSLSGMKAEVSNAWCSTVVAPFITSLKGRYPFGSKGEATISDVAAFFTPGSGIIWGFYTGELAGDILQVGSKFKFDNRLGGMVKKSYQGNIIPYLKKVHKVTSMLFPPGATDPTLQLDVRLLASAAFTVVALDIGGEEIEYRGGPERWKRVVWPMGDPVAGAAVKVKGRGGVEDKVKFPGEWGFWKLLEGGRIIKGKGNTFTLKWSLPRLREEVEIDIRAAGSRTNILKASGKGKKKALRLQLGDMTPPFNIAKGGAPCTP